MKRRILLACAALALGISVPAQAHVGSPDVFFEGDAGPYRLYVTVRSPDVIPGVAAIEIRSRDSDVTAISVVPLRLTGPGSELPPVADRAERSPIDPQFFTAGLWLMERGSLQVRISVDGARGPGKLAVPVPAFAQRTLPMSAGLGALLFGLMLVLALAVIAIVSGAIREATLEPGVLPAARDRKRARTAAIVAAGSVVVLLGLGRWWWSSTAAQAAATVARPWQLAPRVDGCQLHLGKAPNTVRTPLLLDHGHEMHLFVVHVPALDRLAHLHPVRGDDGAFVQRLPALPAGRYRLFADIVSGYGYPLTGVGEIDVPDLACTALDGDDASWSPPEHAAAGPARATAELSDGAHMIWERSGPVRAGVASSLRFHVVGRGDTPVTLESYMGMAGHAAIIATDLSVFAHLHPAGSVSMPALELANAGVAAGDPHAGHAMQATLPPDVAFPYGFPKPGAYRVFVQVKLADRVETGAFDVTVEPAPGRPL
jgi:hypothetical protein